MLHFYMLKITSHSSSICLIEENLEIIGQAVLKKKQNCQICLLSIKSERISCLWAAKKAREVVLGGRFELQSAVSDLWIHIISAS